MQVSPTEGENVGNGSSVIAWVVLLFVLTMAGALPLIVGGINLDSLSQSSPLRVLTAYASTLAALLIAAKTGGSHTLLRQVATWRVGVDGGSLTGGEPPRPMDLAGDDLLMMSCRTNYLKGKIS